MSVRQLHFLALSMVLVSCAPRSSSTSTSTLDASSIETIAQEDTFFTTELENEVTIIINTMADLETLWGRIYAAQEAPEFPQVDFKNESVVLVSPGAQGT